MDAYINGIQASPRGTQFDVERQEQSEDATDFFGIEKVSRKVRAGAKSAAKVRGVGKIEGFRFKEREKVYLRCTRELE